MITAVDTNVLLDVLTPGATHAAESEVRLATALAAGSLVICEPVMSELTVRLSERRELTAFLMETGIRLAPSNPVSLHLAGLAWKAYSGQRPQDLRCSQCGTGHELTCQNCGQPVRARQHILADFLIGAHAQNQTDGLLTRDRGFYGTNFPELGLF